MKGSIVEIPIWPEPLTSIVNWSSKAQERLTQAATQGQKMADELKELQVHAILGLSSSVSFDGGLLSKMGIPDDIVLEGAVNLQRAGAAMLSLSSAAVEGPIKLTETVANVADVQAKGRSLAQTEQRVQATLAAKAQDRKNKQRVIDHSEAALLQLSSTGRAEIIVRGGKVRFQPSDATDEIQAKNIAQRSEISAGLRHAIEPEESLRRREQRLRVQVDSQRGFLTQAVEKAKKRNLSPKIVAVALASGLIQGGKDAAGKLLLENEKVGEKALRIAARISLSRI